MAATVLLVQDERKLAPTEWGILVALATVPGRVNSQLELINRVRGFGSRATSAPWTRM